jgi:arginine-tRNA-protein transferase
MHTPREVVIYDQPEACPYLPGRMARLPLRLPAAKLRPEEFDQRLENGDRRSGQFLYTTACSGCRACEPIRIDVAAFRPSKTQARIARRGKSLLRAVVQPPLVDDARVALFNLHKRGRGLANVDRSNIDVYGYAAFLAESCCDTVEIAYFLGEQLIMVAILDVGGWAMSAVYTYFDPAQGKLSPGVYSVLYQIELGRRWNRRHLYLGYYVADNKHMRYKTTYRPHERKIGGVWREFSGRD